MKRSEWLMQLEQELTRKQVARAKEILADYEEHFAAAVDAGKSEEDVAAKLGDPKAVAKAHAAESLVTQATRPDGKPADMGSIMNATLRLLVLTPFTFLMLVGPFAIAGIFLMVGWAVAVALGGMSLAGAVVAAVSWPFLLVSVWGTGALLFGIVALVGFTILGLMTMWVITRWSLTLFISYMRWNVDFVLEKNK